MEVQKNVCESICMIGGNGPQSYAKNSSYQRAAVDCSKAMINEAIENHLDTKQVLSSTPFCIADLGCSVGPNTFVAVQNIIEAVEHKYKLSHPNPLEFQVFFNDHTSNDFNTLFSTLPSDRRYFATGAPGSFYGRLFPTALHFVYSSYTLHWLSKVPEGVGNKHSPEWNKGRIHYTNASSEVFEAYSDQFAKDMQLFLKARAQEVVPEGLMALVIPGVSTGTIPSKSFICLLKDLLGRSLMDMANMGLVSEDKVNSFNLPIYYSTSQELERLIQTNGSFSIERMVTMKNPMKHALNDPQICTMHVRTGLEELIKEHFGSEILDELFNRYTKKNCSRIFIPL